MKYKCANCDYPLFIPSDLSGVVECKKCTYNYEYATNYLRYDFDNLLFKNFKKIYPLYKVLNNNGYLSYQFLPEASLSLIGRKDVDNFKNYIEFHISSGMILDVGCGVLELPAYLDFEDKSKYKLFGIDPIDDRSFSGMRITGCGEFMPFEDNQFDAVIFATSLDHVCSLKKTINESNRILSKNGKVLIWMSDRSEPLLSRIKNWFWIKIGSFREGYRKDKFAIYPNWTVFYIPNGAIDPYHYFREKPTYITRLMKKNGFRHEDTIYNNKNEVFLCFRKTN